MVRMRSRSEKALRSAFIWACRLLSSTIRPGQTRLISSSLLTTAPLASISTTSTSKARPPSSIGRPSARTSRRCSRILKRPNSKLAGASDTGSIVGDCSRPFQTNSDLFSLRCRVARQPVRGKPTRSEGKPAAPGLDLRGLPVTACPRHSKRYTIPIQLPHRTQIFFSPLSMAGSFKRRWITSRWGSPENIREMRPKNRSTRCRLVVER
jgi:hypothetical protein